MQYRIEYTPDWVKKKIPSRKFRILPLLGIALLALLVWYDWENVIHTALAVEELAQFLQTGVSPSDAISAFCEGLSGAIGG